MSSAAFDVAVLGGGPAGLVAALDASRRGRTALVVDRLPTPHDPPRIDAVPARTLALLLELGVDPPLLGVDRLHDGRWASWETQVPEWQAGPRTAHVERPRLECALADVVRATGNVTIVVERARPQCADRHSGNGWSARHVIDATGRAAVTACTRVRPAAPWGSLFFWTPHCGADPAFRIAALANGYAYRLGCADTIGIGVVGRSRLLKADPASLDRVLRDSGAAWLCEGMPPLASMMRGRRGISSVQWTEPGRAALAGDASLARDALSSQGIAASLSDGFYAAAAVGTDALARLHRRQERSIAAHLTSLGDALSRCRFRDRPMWRAYEGFVRGQTRVVERSDEIALQEGRLVTAFAP